MSTSKQYPYFGTIDDQLVHASAIVHFTAPETGMVVWASDPEKIKVGEVSNKWNETFFVPVTDPFTVEYLNKSVEPAKQMYALTYCSEDIEFIQAHAVSSDIGALGAFANEHVGNVVTFREDLKQDDTWIGRTHPQSEDFWLIEPVVQV